MARKKSAGSSSGATRTRVVKGSKNEITVRESAGNVKLAASKLTDKEVTARKIKKYATTTFGLGVKTAFESSYGADISGSQQGNFYSPQLSTDFLEKPQNLRERRAWYRHFYNSNEFVRSAVDLHSSLPLSKIKLTKPKCKNDKMRDYVYTFFEDMCSDMRLFKSLMEISHDYWLLGNTFVYAEDHDPYNIDDEAKVEELKQRGRLQATNLKEKFDFVDKDPNYLGWRRLLVLPPDQVVAKPVPLSDEVFMEFQPDPETKKTILGSDRDYLNPRFEEMAARMHIPEKIKKDLEGNGAIPLDTDPYTGSHVYHLARKKSQYETQGVSILEACVNTLLLQDKLRQAQTSIASRHMTPIRIVWAEELNESDVEALREQVDLALVDPDFSIIANYELHWEEMGSNGRLLELSAEYEHIENSLFAGLNVTREILTGEGTYAGSRITLEIMNRLYLLYRDQLQEYVEEYLFKPVAKKKGFIEEDEFGRERLVYPKLSFTRLAIKDNDAYFDQIFQLYNRGSVSLDVLLETLGIDPDDTPKAIESELLTVKDPNFGTFMQNIYTSSAQAFVERYDLNAALAEYLGLPPAPMPPAGEGEGGAGGGLGDLSGAPGGERFSSENMTPRRKAALQKLVQLVSGDPEKLDKIANQLEKK